MAAEIDPIFEVSYKSCTRAIRRSELQRAPDSLLSKILLQDADSADTRTLVIPSHGAAPDCATWQDGDASLFEVCMDCYTNPTDRHHEQLVLAENILDICVQRMEASLSVPTVLLTNELNGRAEFHLHLANNESVQRLAGACSWK
ncbi:hypothetical protein WJX73_005864 [Symbiochloris irregularis]|uniref:Uncharacterized protein n=1 Tax=Symbiochloris irregularis TaxID=706552 RepID=A0AAW1NNC7_9CHLO